MSVNWDRTPWNAAPGELSTDREEQYDAEPEEDFEEEREEPEAWQRYDLFTNADGSIEGTASTNDDRDLGYPNEESQWDVRYRNREEMLKRTGGSHIGCSGIRVTVYLDCAEIRR